MPPRLNSKWISYKEKNFWAAHFSGKGYDRETIAAEIQATEKVICDQLENSLLVGVDLFEAQMTPEIVEFFRVNCNRPKSPVRKMAILGVSGMQKVRYRFLDKIEWPKQSKFFDDWESAKAWLVSERF